MSKKIETGSSEMGDISGILHNNCVSDLSWLDINIDDYHKAEALPKQNIDIIPELQRALTYNEDNIPVLIPLRPHTMVNTNPLDPPGSPFRNVAPEISNKVAKYIISGNTVKDINDKLSLEFSSEQIEHASDEIDSIVSDIGLMGNVFINSKHFPRCAQNSEDKRFVANKAKSAKFILAKDECDDCIHNKGGMCSNLGKQLVESVSYDRKTFAKYAVELSQVGRLHKDNIDEAISGSDEDRKKTLQLSFCSRNGGLSNNDNKLNLRHYDKVKTIKYSDDEVKNHLANLNKTESVLSDKIKLASKQIMLGNIDVITHALDKEVRDMHVLHGVLGHTYIDMDALGGCNKTLKHISKMSFSPDFVVRRSAKCDVCKCEEGGSCSKIQDTTSIVNDINIDKNSFISSLKRAIARGVMDKKIAKRIFEKFSNSSNFIPIVSKINLLQPSDKKLVKYSGSKIKAHNGSSTPSREMSSTTEIDHDTVYRSISHMMNTGLSGKELKNRILAKFSKEDLVKFPGIGKKLSLYDGIQGSYFINPTIYKDYGKGCSIGSKQFRKIGASNIVVGSSCTGCTLQTAPGWCSKYSKSLIRSIPKSVIVAARHDNDVKISCEPVENPVDKYELKSEVMIEEKNERKVPEINL